MLRKLLKNRKAQNTAEYAILISLVVAGIIAMQTYAQRALQAKVRDAAIYMSNSIAADDNSGIMGSSTQYEPYYLTTDYTVGRDETVQKSLGNAASDVRLDSLVDRTRTGSQNMAYNTAMINGNF